MKIVTNGDKGGVELNGDNHHSEIRPLQNYQDYRTKVLIVLSYRGILHHKNLNCHPSLQPFRFGYGGMRGGDETVTLGGGYENSDKC